MVTCEAGVVVCHGALSARNAKRSFQNHFVGDCAHVGFVWMEGVRRTGAVAAPRRPSLGWCGRRGVARGLLLVIVACLSANR